MKILSVGLSLVYLATAISFASEASQRRWNLLDAGATGDGVKDCTMILQKLLDDAGTSGGGIVEVPAGQFRINGNLSVPANVTLQGIYRIPPTTGPKAFTNLTGSVLFAYSGRGSTNSKPFIQLSGNHASIIGLIIAYPEWKQTDVPPVPYPPCVFSQDTENVGIIDCLLLNPYEAIKFVRAHRHLIRNVNGYPCWRGIYVDECYDIGRIENVHFWPFGVSYEAKNPFCEWVNTQAIAFEFARTDWHYVLNTFCFGFGIGYKFSQSKHGSANGNFLGIGADSCQRAVVVEQAQPPGLLISNGEFVGRWSSTNSVCLEILPKVEGKVSLVNCSFWGPIDRCVWMQSPAGQFTASACNFVHWDNRGVDSPAIQLDAGRAIIQGCTFGQDNLHVQVASNVVSAILTGNQAVGGFRVESDAGKRVQMALNEENNVHWSNESKLHYKITLGEPGDGRYLRGWHGAEYTNRSFRWTLSDSRIVLPVLSGITYSISIDAHVPEKALIPDAGLFVGGRKIATLDRNAPMKVILPKTEGTNLVLEIRCNQWCPQKEVTGSQDSRLLGIQVFSINMRGDAAGENIFSANTGLWLNEISKNK